MISLYGFEKTWESIRTEIRAFEPKKETIDGTNKTKTEAEAGASVRSTMLAWQDSFRTFEWERAIPSPEGALAQIGELLSLAL